MLCALAAEPAHAQEAQSPPISELFALRARYGVALRRGEQADVGPGLAYSGLTPNDFAFSLRYFGEGMIGGAATAQREGFALFTPDRTPVTGGGLLRGSVGPAGRLSLGPITLEALLGYQFAQLPAFGNSAAPEFTALSRHSALGAARLSVELPIGNGIRLEGRGEYPFPLIIPTGTTETATSSGFAAGGSIVVPLGTAGTVVYSVVADYQFVTDKVTVGTGLSGEQTIQRAGVALELAFLSREPPPKFGSVLVRAVDADTGQQLPSPTVKVVVGSRDYSTSRQADGASFQAVDVEPGQAVARAVAGGYLPAEAGVKVVAGQQAVIDLKVKKEPPKVGALAITLVDKESGSPVANATVKVRGVEQKTGDDGTVTFNDLQPGPAPIEVAAPEYRPVEEVGSVVVLKTSTVALQLVKAKRALPATITGLVRSTTGRAVSAQLEMPQAKVKTRTSGSGSFTIRVPGGTYNVIISASGYLTQTKTVTVRDGDQAIFNVDLHPSSR